MPNLVGKDGRLFAEPIPGADAIHFQIDNTSQQYFNSPYYRQHKTQLQPVPPPRVSPPRIALADVMGQGASDAIQAAGRIAFHAVGDTGAAVQGHLAEEEGVADAMAAEVQSGGSGAPAFFFHLGDVVYFFGEGQYYYDQFYNPYRGYDRPIFAIPGNHDGVVYGGNTTSPAHPTLEAFLRNFCAPTAESSSDAGSLIRSTMTQPGVYFTLDAPLISIIGLYSNVLEGPGVISSQRGSYPIGDEQLQFLQAELTRLKPARQNGERAVIVAVHHPPLSVDTKHGGYTGLTQDLDSAATAAVCGPTPFCRAMPISISASRAIWLTRQRSPILLRAAAATTPRASRKPSQPFHTHKGRRPLRWLRSSNMATSRSPLI